MISPSTSWSASWRASDPLAVGLPARVDDHHLEVAARELEAEHLDEALLAEVLQRAGEDADEARAAAGERPRDRVARVPELLGGLAHARLGLLGRLHATQGVRDRRG